jgi:hypothetical protein
MTVARPTRKERNAIRTDGLSKHRRKRVTSGLWNFESASEECEAAGFKMHNDAQIEWNKQTAPQSQRKMLMKNGKLIKMVNIMSGATRAVPLTAKEKAIICAKRSKTRLQRGYKQLHWLEVASFVEAFHILNVNQLYEYATVPDSHGADFLVRRKGTQLWCPIQVKSAVAHPDERITFSKLKAADGDEGGRYENMVILAVAVAPGCMPPDATAVFDAVADVEVKELLLYNRASDMPATTLRPCPRKHSADQYGDDRYVVGFDDIERLEIMRTNFVQCIEANAKWTKADAWFGPELNPSLRNLHIEELRNCKTLGDLLGHERLRAPHAQGETVDVMLLLDNREVKISLKTATLHGKGFQFKLHKAPNCHFCDVVLAFCYDKVTQERTHVSVIPSQRVYVKDKMCFSWSSVHKQNKDVWQNKIDLREPHAVKKLLIALKHLE